jgi:hypothetical protein
MPLRSSLVGTRPKESPLLTDTSLTWTMNFCAGARCNDRDYYDNEGGKQPQVHPFFLASCAEIIGAWACVYACGVTKPEIVKHTFAHHTFHAIFRRPIRSGERILTDVQMTGIGQKRSGAHFYCCCDSVDELGQSVGTSYWGGVLLGATTDGPDNYNASPPTPCPTPTNGTTFERVVSVSSLQAHIWDAW